MSKALKNKFAACKERFTFKALTCRTKLQAANEACILKGESYTGEVFKILIAVVLGAMLLWALYALFGDTVVPELTEKITGIFDSAPTAPTVAP